MDPVLQPLIMAKSAADSFSVHWEHHTSRCLRSDCLGFAKPYSSSILHSSLAQLSLCLWSLAFSQSHSSAAIAPAQSAASAATTAAATSLQPPPNSSSWCPPIALSCLSGTTSAESTAGWTHSWSCGSHTCSIIGWSSRNYCAWSI